MGNDFNIQYIVYETTNLVNKKIYIGVHKTMTPYVFDGYLGCGVISTQPNTYEKAKTAFQYAVKKYGPKNFYRKTLAVFENYQQAFELERELVDEKFIAREDTYNMILGGLNGLYESEQKKVFQYSLTGAFLAEYDSFYKAGVAVNKDYTSISYAVKHKSKCCNFFWSTDKLDNLDISLYNLGDSGKVTIYVYTHDGLFYTEFSSIKETCLKMNVSNVSVRDACEYGISYNNYYYSFIKKETFSEAKKEYFETRTVFQYDSVTGRYLAEFVTQMEAEKQFPKSQISKSIRLKEDDGNGYKWLLIKHPMYITKRTDNEKKPVEKYTLDGQLVHTFQSATEAAKTDGVSVWNCLRGKNQTYKKHIYKYKISDIV